MAGEIPVRLSVFRDAVNSMVGCGGSTVFAGNRQRRCEALSRLDNAAAEAARSGHSLSGESIPKMLKLQSPQALATDLVEA